MTCCCRFGKYELHDLVVLDQQTTGVIVTVEKDSCKVLTSDVSVFICEQLRFYRHPGSTRPYIFKLCAEHG